MEHNPYAPPKAEVGIPVMPGDEVLASRILRFLNLLIDTLGYYALGILLFVGISFVDPSFIDRMQGTGPEYAFGALVMVLYYLPSEAFFGRTLGKLVTGTRTVSESGGAPTFAQVFRRTLVRFIPFEAFTFFKTPPIGLHDRWSETRVVRTRPQ